jgi:zinc protease
VTPADVSEVAEAAWSTGLLRTPRGAAADWAGFVAAPTSSPDAVPGTSYASLEDPGVRLIVGDQGVTIVDQGTYATVRFDACAAMLAWPDGARQLVGHDAIMVRLEPTLYAGSIAALPWVDAKIPPSLRVDMPAREADRIPVPQPVAPAAAPASPRGKALPIIGIVVLSPIALIFAAFTLIGLTGLGDDGDELGAAIFLAIVCLLITAGSGYGIYRAIRRLRR